jgi:ankyrin repeat protein
MLLDKGADPNARMANGASVLARASARPQNEQVIELLSKAGAR